MSAPAGMPVASEPSPRAQALTMKRLTAFFIPLAASATLVTVSHVIINSTLARAVNPEVTIASYAIAMSVLGIAERPAILLRQTCSALVRDRVSFRAMRTVSAYVLLAIVLVGLLLSYTPAGPLIFTKFFAVDELMLPQVMETYRVLMFVSLFSGIRCLYHGIIIFNLRTKWLTIGMVIRIVAMYMLAMAFVRSGEISGAVVGAIIFLTGMIIEAALSMWEGNRLLRTAIPEKLEDHPIETGKQIFQFYRPLLYSSLIAVVIGPAINAVLGKTVDIQLAIASYAIAFSVAYLIVSPFSYIHQLVLNFYRKDAALVFRFTLIVSMMPGLIIGIACYTPVAAWFLQTVMGVSGRLMEAALANMKIFMIYTLLFPWLDYVNGLIMHRGQTGIMVLSQAANAIITVIALLVMVSASPGWNGMIGAAAQSAGVAAEMLVVIIALKVLAKH